MRTEGFGDIFLVEASKECRRCKEKKEGNVCVCGGERRGLKVTGYERD